MPIGQHNINNKYKNIMNDVIKSFDELNEYMENYDVLFVTTEYLHDDNILKLDKNIHNDIDDINNYYKDLLDLLDLKYIDNKLELNIDDKLKRLKHINSLNIVFKKYINKTITNILYNIVYINDKLNDGMEELEENKELISIEKNKKHKTKISEKEFKRISSELRKMRMGRLHKKNPIKKYTIKKSKQNKKYNYKSSINKNKNKRNKKNKSKKTLKKVGGGFKQLENEINGTKKILNNLINDTIDRGNKIKDIHEKQIKLLEKTKLFYKDAKKINNKNNDNSFNLIMSGIIGISGMAIIYALR